MMTRAIRWRLLAVACFAAAAGWQLWWSRAGTRRIPEGWEWSARYIGSMTFSDSTGLLPREDQFGTYRRRVRWVESPAPGMIVLEDEFTIMDPVTRKVTYQYVTREQVDPATGAYADPRYRGQVAVFPRHVEQRTYILRANYLEGIPVAFEREEEVLGVPTYLFGYRGRGEYTASYAGSDEYSGVAVSPGQAIRCADDQFSYRAWVEPMSGEIVKLEEGCRSGDYIYDVASGRRMAAVGRWDGVTSGNDLYRLADASRDERARLLWSGRLGPLLALAGLLILLTTARSSHSRRET
jgi:DUF3068 family protein